MHVDHGVELLFGHVLDDRVPGVPRVVHDNVHVTVGLNRQAREPCREVRLRDAAHARDCLPACALDFAHDVVRRLRVDIVHD